MKSKTKTKIKSKIKSKTKTQTQIKSKTYVISECYNNKFNELITDKLRFYLNKYNFTEYNKIKILDLNILKSHNKKLQNDCKEQINLFKTTKFPQNIVHTQYDFIWLSPISKLLDKRYYTLKCDLINIIAEDKLKNIVNKDLLFKNMENYDIIYKKHVAKTFYINQVEKYIFDGNKHYILRPIDSFAGKNILYISSKKELNDALKYYNITKNYRGNVLGNNVIASEYIINPLLYKGHKFHLRMYYLISYIDNIFNSFLLDIGDLLTADKPYNIIKPFTKEVHDTHQTSSDDDYFFPKDIENETNINKNDIANIMLQIRKILKYVSKIIEDKEDKEWVYPGNKNGFYVMGVDFMVDENKTVYLIEVNHKPGYSYVKRQNNIYFSNILFDWISDVILEPYYKYKDIKKARLHSTYLE